MTIYVEGKRSFDGKLLPFKKGPFYLAMECGVPGGARDHRRHALRDAERQIRHQAGPGDGDFSSAYRARGFRQPRMSDGEGACCDRERLA